MPISHVVAARPRSAAGALSLFMAGALLGTAGPTGALLSRTAGLSPVAVAAYRLAVGGALIVAFLAVAGRPWPRGRAAWTRIAAVGALTGAYQACYFTSVSLTSVSLATLVAIGMAPALVLAAEAATGRRQADRRIVGTICLALVGLGLLVGWPAVTAGSGTVLAGAGLAVLAAGGFATVTLVGARPVAGLDEASTVGFGFAAGGLLLAPIAALTVGLGFRPDAATVGLLLVLGAAPTAVAYTLYLLGLRTMAASTAAVMALLEPLTGALLAALLLGDRLGAGGVAGAALLAAAVLLAATAS